MSKKEAFQKEKQRFENFLKTKNLKLTKARMKIFEQVFHCHGHFSAEDLLRQCKENKVKVSRASVYRSLNELLEAGVIRLTAFGEKHHHYEHLYDEKPHHHAYCIKSGKIIDLPDMGEEEKYMPILEKMGFKVLGHEVHFYGISQECLEE